MLSFKPAFFTFLFHPDGVHGKESACQCRRHRDSGLIPGSGRSPGGEDGIPLQYSCQENCMDRGAWWAIVHGATEMVITERLSKEHCKTTPSPVNTHLGTSLAVVVKNPPSNTGDTSSIPGGGTKTPYASWKLSLSPLEPAPQQRPDATK